MDIFVFGLIGFKLKGKTLPRLHEFTFPNKNEENDKTVLEKNLFYEKILERWQWKVSFALSLGIRTPLCKLQLVGNILF